MVKPEEQACQRIDELLKAAGWQVQDYSSINLAASLGVAVREFHLQSAKGSRELLEPVVARYRDTNQKLYFRGDAAFDSPEVYEYLEESGILYAIRIAAYQNLHAEVEHLLTRPVVKPPKKPRIFYHSFFYRAASWTRSRRIVGKVEWHAGELFPRVGFIVTNLQRKAPNVTRFYNRRGKYEQWTKEGKLAGNFLRRFALPREVSHW